MNGRTVYKCTLLSLYSAGEGSRLGSGKPPTKKSRFKEQREGGRREGERGRAGDDKVCVRVLQ